jgi:lauroyl/myristoyl acyltransferase
VDIKLQKHSESSIQLKGVYWLCWRLVNSPALIRRCCATWIAYLIYQFTKHKLHKRIQQVMPDKAPQQVKHIAKQSTQSAIAEFTNMLAMPHERIELENIKDLQLAKATGAVFASVHLGQTEVSAYAVQQLGFDVCTLIGSGERNPQLNLLGTSLLDALGIPYLKKQKGLLFKLLEQIRQKKCVFIHSDLREKGLEVTFLGQTTEVPMTAAFLAVSTKAPLYFIFPVRQHDRIVIHLKCIANIEDILGFSGSRQALIEALTRKVVEQMQMAIEQYPEHWFWHYNRFKIR